MRHAAVTLVGIAILALGFTAAGGGAAPAAVEVRSCAQAAPALQIQLVGDKDAALTFGVRHIPLPEHTAAVVVWSLGGPASTRGIAIHAWIAGTRMSLSSRCSTVRKALKPPSLSGLEPAVRVRDGQFTGRRFACVRRGRVLVEVQDVAGGKRFVVRMQRGGEVLAVAEVKRGSGWLRGSKRCTSGER